jgi:hypothetical protein
MSTSRQAGKIFTKKNHGVSSAPGGGNLNNLPVWLHVPKMLVICLQ